MAEHRPLGDILLESGRIEPSDVERVLAFQRENGGYFGEALVALGIASRGEIDWALASQFDLPFIFPTAEAVDPDAARLVPPDWALAHLAVPIVRAGKNLTVVLANPLKGEALRELSARTGLSIDMALASADRVRDLIRAVYAVDEGLGALAPRSCGEFLAEAASAAPARFGLSCRGIHALGWLQTEQGVQRMPLHDGWEEHLAAALVPPPVDPPSEAVAHWECLLHAGGRAVRLEARMLAAPGGSELLLRPLAEEAAAPHLDLPDTVIAELRLLASGGRARVALRAADAARGRAMLPHLPRAVLGGAVRAVHLAPPGTPEHAFTIQVEPGAAPPDIAPWGFDAVTADLPLDQPGLRTAMAASPVFFVHSAAQGDDARLRALGVGWLLDMPAERDTFGWTLRPLGT